MKYKIAKEKIINLVTETILSGDDLDDLRWSINALAKSGSIEPAELQALVIQGWEQAVAAQAADEPMSAETELRLVGLQRYFSLPRNDLDHRGAFSQVARLVILRKVMEGEILDVQFGFPIPFELHDESLIWAKRNVVYGTEVSRVHYVGGSPGIEMMAGDGLLFQADDIKGRAVESKALEAVGTGTLAITSRHLYFDDGAEHFCIAYDDIASLEASDGSVVLHRKQDESVGFQVNDESYLYKLLALMTTAA